MLYHEKTWDDKHQMRRIEISFGRQVAVGRWRSALEHPAAPCGRAAQGAAARLELSRPDPTGTRPDPTGARPDPTGARPDTKKGRPEGRPKLKESLPDYTLSYSAFRE